MQRLTNKKLLQCFNAFAIIVCAIFMLQLVNNCEALPIGMDDLYDDVENFFDAVSLDEVATSSSGRDTKPETFCRMPARKGVCRALIPRWSYDPVKKDCLEFKFGGCDGNENNFTSYKQCMSACQGM